MVVGEWISEKEFCESGGVGFCLTKSFRDPGLALSGFVIP